MNKIFNIKINGKDIDNSFPVNYIEVNNSINNIPYCIIRLYEYTTVNGDFTIDKDDLKIGAKVDIEIDDDFVNNGQKDTIFSGLLINKSFVLDSNLEEYYVELKCYHKFYNMTLSSKCNYFIDKKDDEIINTIVSDYGYSVNLGTMDIKRDFLYQNNISDWDFISLIAKYYGYVVSIDKEKLIIDKPSKDKSKAKVELGQNLLKINLTLDGESQNDSIEGKFWDIKNQKCSDIIKNTNTEKENSFGNVKASDINKVAGNKKSLIINDSISELEYKKYLDSYIELNRYQKIHGYITILCDNSIIPNTTIDIDKCSKAFNGSGYINKVQHIYDNKTSRWITKLYVGLKKQDKIDLKDNFNIGGIVGLKYGIVLKLDGDPENNYRVFVNIPSIHKSGEGVWCRISSLYASKECGFHFFPEKDDEVILGFVENNPKEPIILGSFYNSKNKSSVTVDAENKIKSIKTKAGFEINFDEKDNILKINTDLERYITLSNSGECIEIVNGDEKMAINKDSIEIKCSKDVNISGNNITLNAQNNIKIKGNNEISADGNNVKINGNISVNIKGSTSAKVESSGITEIKGSMVKLN